MIKDMPDKKAQSAPACDIDKCICYNCGRPTPFIQGTLGFSCPFCGANTLDGVFAKKEEE